MLAKIGCGASGGGGGRLQAALAGGGTGAPGRPCGGAPGGRVQQLVDAIIELGYLPTQCNHSTVAEKQLAVRLIRARKAGSLSSEQEAALDNLAQGAAQHLVDAIIALGALADPKQEVQPGREDSRGAVDQSTEGGIAVVGAGGRLGNMHRREAHAGGAGPRPLSEESPVEQG